MQEYQLGFGGRAMETKLKDIVHLVLLRVGEDPEDPDENEIPIIKNAINQGYFILRQMVDQRTDVYTVEYDMPIVLPSEVGDIVDIVHSSDGRLGVTEYTKAADTLYVFTPLSKGELAIKYIVLPKKLVDDEDVIELNEMYIPALSAYGAYSYQLYRKKYASAQMHLAEFESYVGQRIQTMPGEGGEA